MDRLLTSPSRRASEDHRSAIGLVRLFEAYSQSIGSADTALGFTRIRLDTAEADGMLEPRAH